MTRLVYGSLVAAFALLGGCTVTAAKSICGDGVVDTGETCDDGNTTSGDGCSSSCQTESINPCGNGHLDSGETCDDGNTIAGDGCSATCQTEIPPTHKTTATWAIKNVDGTVLGCPSGYDTAAVYSQQLDGSGNPVGNPVIDLFTCATFTGQTGPLTDAVYKTWVAIVNTANTMTFEQSLAANVDLRTADKTFSVQILNNGGYFALTWNLVGETSGNPLTCATAGATGVEAVSTDIANSSNTASDIFTCTDGTGVSAGFLAATYTVSVDALNSSMSAIGTAPTLTNKDILSRNRVTDLGTVTIPITGL